MAEGRRGEVEACWSDGPGRLNVAAAEEEQMGGQEEVEGEQMEGQEEVEGERKQEKEVGACLHEKGREEQRTKKESDGGWRFGALLSCEAQARCSSQLVGGGSMWASGRLMSLSGTLERNVYLFNNENTRL